MSESVAAASPRQDAKLGEIRSIGSPETGRAERRLPAASQHTCLFFTNGGSSQALLGQFYAVFAKLLLLLLVCSSSCVLFRGAQGCSCPIAARPSSAGENQPSFPLCSLFVGTRVPLPRVRVNFVYVRCPQPRLFTDDSLYYLGKQARVPRRKRAVYLSFDYHPLSSTTYITKKETEVAVSSVLPWQRTSTLYDLPRRKVYSIG